MRYQRGAIASGSQPGTMGDVEHGVRGEGQRQNCQRVSRIAHQRRGGDDEKSDREGDVEADTLHTFVGDGQSNVRAGRHRQQQRRELTQAQLGHEAIRRRRRDLRCADGVPREPDRQAATATAIVRKPSVTIAV